MCDKYSEDPEPINVSFLCHEKTKYGREKWKPQKRVVPIPRYSISKCQGHKRTWVKSKLLW